MKKITTWLAVAGLGAAGLGAWWVQNDAAKKSAAPVVADAKAPGRAAPGGTAGPGGPGGPGKPVAVEVTAVRQQRLVQDTEAVGSLRSRQGVMLRPELSGRIARIEFTDGQRVKRGQLLIQLDDRLPRAQQQQAQAQLAIARTQWQRNRELVAQGFVSQSAVDQSAAAVDVALAQVALASAQLERSRILAPFDGLAGIRQVNVGDYVKDGADLVAIEDLSQILVDYRLPERFLSQLKPGQAVDITIDAFPGQQFKAQVQALDALVDAGGRSMLVRARLLQPDQALRPGMFARARTVLSVREQALVVPEEALVPQGGKQFLIKVVDGPKGQIAQRMEASIGARADGQVEILKGLENGELIVTAGQERLMRGDSQPVRIVTVGPKTGAAPAAKPASAGAPPAKPASAASAAQAASKAASKAEDGSATRPAV